MDMGLYTKVYYTVFTLVIGSIFGSFLNVWIYRLARGESVVTPRSHCPQCGYPIQWHDNLPVLSYFLLRGRCRNCRAPISIQYPLVEAACAGLAFILWLKNGYGAALLIDFTFLFLLLGIAVTDARSYIIPDLFTLGGMLAGLLFSLLPGGITPLQSVVGLLAGGVSFYLVALAGELIFKKEAMGGGDVKMMAMVGAFLGWPGVVFTVFTGSLAGSLIFGWINYVMRKKVLVPFGVFLSLGGALYVFFGTRLIGWYLGFFNL